MNSEQIDSILQQNCLVSKMNYLGVFPSDRIPHEAVKTYPCCAVVNTKPHNHPGMHWVCFVKDSHNNGVYFDSYGYPPYNLESVALVLDHCNQWDFNNQQLQTLFSTVCGQYCIFFLLHFAKGYTLPHITELLNDAGDTYSNDAFVFSYIGNKYNNIIKGLKRIPISDNSFW